MGNLRIGEHDYDLPLDGQARAHEGLDGDDVMVSASLRGEDLHQVFRGDRGTRRLQFRFHSDGHVSLETTIESGHLPRDITYSLRYRRAN